MSNDCGSGNCTNRAGGRSTRRFRRPGAAALAASLVVLAVSGLSGGDRALGQADGKDSIASRWQRLESMSAQEKEELRHKSERFYRLPELEQDRLRELQQELSARPDADRLRGVMKRYAEWLRTLPSSERTELLSLSVDQRLEKIAEFKQLQEARQFRRLVSRPLLLDDAKNVYAWLDKMVEANEQALLEKLPPQRREEIESETDDSRRRRKLMFSFRFQWENAFEKVDKQDMQNLVAQLSPEANAALAEVRTEADKEKLIRQWCWAALSARWNIEVSQDKLMEFYLNELTDEERRRLDDMSRDQMLWELRRRYSFSQGEGGFFRPPWVGGRGRGGFRGDGRGGDGPGGFRGGPGRGAGPDGPGRGRPGPERGGFGGERGGQRSPDGERGRRRPEPREPADNAVEASTQTSSESPDSPESKSPATEPTPSVPP